MKKLYFLVLLQFLSHYIFGLNITIIESRSLNSGHDMDKNWSKVITSMGHSPTIVPQSTLDTNSFFSSTDILIVSSGGISLSPKKINTILAFLKSGKPVYLQSEYLPTFSTNIAFANLVTSLGGTFKWDKQFAGDLKNMNVLGTYSYKNNTVKSLSYYWYSVSGIGDCNFINFLENKGAYHGFQFIPTNSSFGTISTTTDQDWVQKGTSTQLMENIITHLISPPSIKTGIINLGNDTVLCSGDSLTKTVDTGFASYLWNTGNTKNFNKMGFGTYSLVVTGLNNCKFYDTIRISASSVFDTIIENIKPLCANVPDINISVKPKFKGHFYGSNIDSTGHFNVRKAGAGNHAIYYFLKDSYSCQFKDSAIIKIISSPDASITAAGPYCKNSGIKKLNPAFNRGGKFSGGNFIDTLGNFDPMKTSSEYNKVYYMISEGSVCFNIDSILVRVDTIPIIGLNTLGPFCLLDSVINLSTTNINLKYNFFGGVFVDSSGKFLPSMAAIGDNKVFALGRDKSGCIAIDSTLITVRPMPIPKVSVFPLVGCEPLVVSLKSGDAYKCEWIENGTLINTMDSFSKLYSKGLYTISLKLTNQYGCNTLVKNAINVLQKPKADFTVNFNQCSNRPISVTAHSDSVYKINRWTIKNIDSIETTNKTGTLYSKDAGTFIIKHITWYPPQLPFNIGCYDTSTKQVKVTDIKAKFDLLESTTSCPVFTFTNQTKNYKTITWNMDDSTAGDNINIRHENQVIYKYTSRTGEFKPCLFVENNDGCRDTLCKTAHVDYLVKLIIPNVFTPGNDDHLNDAFDIVAEGLEEYNLLIYNRWGQKLFESDIDGIGDDGHNWRGRPNVVSPLYPDGSYFYIFNYKAKCEDQAKEVHGIITLIGSKED